MNNYKNSFFLLFSISISILIGLMLTTSNTISNSKQKIKEYFWQRKFLSRKVRQIRKKQKITFAALVKKSNDFEKNICEFPVKTNKLTFIAGNNKKKQREIEWQAANTNPILDKRVTLLMQNFIAYKKKYGSTKEKKLYTSLSLNDFITRLLKNRPLTFYLEQDVYLLRDGTQGQGKFETIGTDLEQAPLILENYLSYDEMAIAALIGVSTPTYFINNGNRYNRGTIGEQGSYQQEGVYTGLVGARFEKPNYMEWCHMVITKEQNTTENGYGQYNNGLNKKTLLDLWAKLYEIDYFPTFEQASQDTSNRFLRIDDKYLDKAVYKKRLELVISPFLADANRRGIESKKEVYCHAVGLGTGVWALHKNAQEQLMLEVYEKLITNHHFSHITDINFSWFQQPASATMLRNGTLITQANNNINIHFSKRDPAEKLIDKDENKLLVAMYAWDGNAYPGNEYWMHNLSGSGDPAAACCSTIQELQNPLINDNVSGKNTIATDIL